MTRRTTLALSTMALLYMASSAAIAQTVEPSYKASPDVYKVFFEDQHFRVIEVVRKKGVHDKAHSHPVPSVVYNLTDCQARIYSADGKTTDSTRNAGTVQAVPVVQSHSAENIGPADCHQLFVERKYVAAHVLLRSTIQRKTP